MEIFTKTNRDFDSVKNSESDYIKVLTRFSGNPILGILIKICNCVGSSYMRGHILMKLRPIACSNFLIFGQFSV